MSVNVQTLGRRAAARGPAGMSSPSASWSATSSSTLAVLSISMISWKSSLAMRAEGWWILWAEGIHPEEVRRHFGLGGRERAQASVLASSIEATVVVETILHQHDGRPNRWVERSVVKGASQRCQSVQFIQNSRVALTLKCRVHHP